MNKPVNNWFARLHFGFFHNVYKYDKISFVLFTSPAPFSILHLEYFTY